MAGTSDEETSLRAYLLGELATDEQLRIEERLLLDRDYVELLLIIEEELLDDYLRGDLPERERRQVENYFLTTPARRRKLRMAKALRRYVTNPRPVPVFTPERKPRSNIIWGQRLLTPAWRAAIAAMLILGLGLGIWRVFMYRSLSDKGRSALQAALRESPTEARMAGFDWPPRQVTLGEPSGNVADKTSLEIAERYLFDAVTAQQGSEAHYALGQLYLAKGQLDSAIEHFEKALEGDPKNARLHSDLGAALLERARAAQEKGSDSSLQDFDQSLKHLNQALALDESLLEALFNRALSREYMQLLSQAEGDWQEYLKRDGNSRWADEARRHLKDIENKKQKTSQVNTDLLQEFLSAYRDRDRETAWKLVSGSRELITGRLIWWQLLGDFLDLTAAGRQAEANERLEALEYVGEMELHLRDKAGQQIKVKAGRRGGDPFLSELGKFYRSSSAQSRAVLAEAHEWVNEGNRLYVTGQSDEALRNYTRAREGYARIRNEGEVMVADLLMAFCLIQKGDMKSSRSLLEGLDGECRKKGYLWLRAETAFSLGRVHDGLAEYSKALEYTSQALEISTEMSDVYNTQRSLAQVADQYRKLGNYELSTTYLNRCLAQISVAWPGNRQMWRNCDQITQVLAARRLNAAAAAYATEALRLALETKDLSFIFVSYIHLALIRSKQQDYAEAIKLAQIGLDATTETVYRAYASLQLGHLQRQAGDFGQALDDYDQSIKYIDSIEAPALAAANYTASAKTDRLAALRYDAHKGRLFCLIAQGNDIPAKEELEGTLELLEKHRENIREEKNRNTFFNVEQSVYDAAIDFEYSRRNDKEAVFQYSERSRARSLLDLISRTPPPIMAVGEVQRRLPDQTQLIEYIVLEDKLLICLVSKSDFSVNEVRIGLSELRDKVLNFRRSVRRPASEPAEEARELYGLLIGRIKLSPENGKQVCIVPDKVLNNLPFNALVSPASGSYFVEEYELTVAPSAAIYLDYPERMNHTADRDHERILAVGNPNFDRTEFSSLPLLPSTEAQVRGVAKFYSAGSPVVLTGESTTKDRVRLAMEEADVIHLASHYVVYEGDPMNSRLLLAQEPRGRREPDSSAGFLRADEVYGLNLRRAPLVVLSACESGVEHYYNGEGMIGMSRVFIAAGAPVVVASLWKVDVYATDELMINFHRHRKLGRRSTPQALRLAQLDMLRDPSKKHPYYWAGFTTIGGHVDF